MMPGDKVTYMSIGTGIRHAATVTRIDASGPKTISALPPGGTTPDFPGSLDLAVDAGESEPVHLTRIELVPADKLTPGTCCRRNDGEDATRR